MVDDNVEAVEEQAPVALEYSGADEYQPTLEEQQKERKFPYLASPELRDAVNLAILLRRPLLLKGEPGCGKTRLAEAVAYEFHKHYAAEEEEEWPYFFWPVKSTSRARDGLYTFDAVSRLRDAQLAAAQKKKIDDDIHNYIHRGPLGKAFAAGRRAIVLIDEIDKADIDFPNDLLIELDEQRYKIDELAGKVDKESEWIWAVHDPIVFITSNDEKELPDAFLRRCIFHYIDFPGHDQLKAIVRAHCLRGEAADYKEDLLETAVTRFEELRQKIIDVRGDSGKRVSTSELIDWFKAILKREDEHRDNPDFLADIKNLPYLSVLLKNRDDQLMVASLS